MARQGFRSLHWVAAVGAASAVLTANAWAKVPGEPESRDNRMVIHEWGTFTSLQDENGDAIGGINADDEPVPEFVHRIASFLIVSPDAGLPILYKGAPRCHPDVTMRLETPVVYFHPPEEARLPLKMDVEVAFHSGWLSEYYPNAAVEAPGVTGAMQFGRIHKRTTGRLTWKDLQIGGEAEGPETSSHVWLAPRQVDAAAVTTRQGESEKYLFYRGVGRLDSPLRVSRSDDGKELTLTLDFSELGETPVEELVVPAAWLVETRADRTMAFRAISGLDSFDDDERRAVAMTSARFKNRDFNEDNVARLSKAMRAALIEGGLYADEADALLSTWKLSYFKSPGLRLFYLLPQAWTDHVLPMSVTPEAQIDRTMVGRIEIMTPQQRELLADIAAGPASHPADWMLQTGRECRDADNPTGNEPADYRAYQELGRFRNALILDELRQRPTPALHEFVLSYGLEGYEPGK